MPVVPQRANTLPIVAPRVGVESRIANVPHARSMKLVGSGLRPRLNLCRPPSFHVHSGDDHTNFLNHVWIDYGGGIETLSMPLVIDAYSVQLKIDITRPACGNAGECGIRIAVTDYPWRQCSCEVYDIAANQWQIHNLLLA